MGICILAKRAVLELGSSTNFVYSLNPALQDSFLFSGNMEKTWDRRSGSSDFYNFFPGFVVNFKTVRTKALEQDFRRLFSFNK